MRSQDSDANPSARQVLSDNVALLVGELLALDAPTLRQSTHERLHEAIAVIEAAADVLLEATTMAAEDQGRYVVAMRRLAETLHVERRA